jgi:hypothetical protein
VQDQIVHESNLQLEQGDVVTQSPLMFAEVRRPTSACVDPLEVASTRLPASVESGRFSRRCRKRPQQLAHSDVTFLPKREGGQDLRLRIE